MASKSNTLLIAVPEWLVQGTIPGNEMNYIKIYSPRNLLFLLQGNSINVNVAIYDHNERSTNHNDDIIKDNFQFTIDTQETDCVFHNMSMRERTRHCHEYVELNISYRLFQLVHFFFCLCF